MKIIYMGTPDFAVPALKALANSEHEVCAVFTQPDKPRGRKMIMTPPDVKVCAEKLNIPVYQPETFKDGKPLEIINKYNPDVIVVAAYGKILPAYVLDYPGLGSVNVHGSLLPMYRGAAPINKVLMDGCEKTGVTTMYMDTGLDTGDMIFKAETEITEDDDFGTLHDRCAALGAELLVKTVDAIEQGTAPRIPQEGQTCYSPMIDNETRRLDMNMSARDFVNRVRGLSPVPCAFCELDGKNLKVYGARLEQGSSDAEPGTVVDGKRFVVRVGDGLVRLTDIQLEGKKRMSAEDFCRGRKPEKLS